MSTRTILIGAKSPILRYITSVSGAFSQSVQAVLAKQLLTESQARWTTRL